MRDVTLSDGTVVTVRGLRRSEIKALAEYGVGHMHFDIASLPKEKRDEAFNAIIDTQFAGQDLENADLLTLFDEISKETYSSGGEEKNLSRSGRSGQTPNEQRTAEHA